MFATDGSFKPAGQILTSFKESVAMGSYQATATTIDGLCNELRYSSGCAGSVSIGTAYTKDGVTIPTGWYNFIWSPHRSGGMNGQANSDNTNYGSLWLSGMTISGCFMVRFANGAIQQVRDLYISKGTWLANIGSGSTTHAAALKSWFDSNKASTPRNSCLGFYSAANGNGSIYTGYFLNGYDSNPYGGFYVAHYNTPYYVGIQNGTYTQYQLATHSDLASYAKSAINAWGTSISFTPTSFAVPILLQVNSGLFTIMSNGPLSGTHNLNVRRVHNGNLEKSNSSLYTCTVTYTATEAALSVGVTITLNNSGTYTVTTTGNAQMIATYY